MPSDVFQIVFTVLVASALVAFVVQIIFWVALASVIARTFDRLSRFTDHLQIIAGQDRNILQNRKLILQDFDLAIARVVRLIDAGKQAILSTKALLVEVRPRAVDIATESMAAARQVGRKAKQLKFWFAHAHVRGSPRLWNKLS